MKAKPEPKTKKSTGNSKVKKDRTQSPKRSQVKRTRPLTPDRPMDTTNFNQVDQELPESEARFRTILDNIEDGYYEVDLKGNLTFVNRAYIKMLGYEKHELIGMGYRQYMSQEMAKVVFQTFNRVYKSEISEKAFNWEWIIKDGARRTIEISISPIKSSYATIVGFRGIVRDITERKQAEIDLQNSERSAHELLETAKRQTRERTLLDKVRTVMAKEMDLPELLSKVVESISETFGYTFVSLYLLDGEYLRLQHQMGYERVIEKIHISQGITGRVIRTRQPIFLKDVSSEPEFLGAMEDLVSEICVPLLDKGQVAGILNVESVRGIHLDEDDLKLMVAMSEHISIAITRARLFGEAQRRGDILSALQESTLAVIGNLELNNALEAILGQAARLMNTSHGYIYMVQSDEQAIQVTAGVVYFPVILAQS